MRESPSPVAPPRPPLSGPASSWSEPEAANARRLFWGLFAVVFAIKLLVAARLPLFVDEAFYWLEGQHLAPAYSDLPGLTAWLARLGVSLGGRLDTVGDRRGQVRTDELGEGPADRVLGGDVEQTGDVGRDHDGS